MAVKLNNSDNYEHTRVFITKEKYPILWQTWKEDLMQNAGMDEGEAEDYLKFIHKDGFEMELYFEKGTGLFLVEPEAVESGTIYSPYTGELADELEEI